MYHRPDSQPPMPARILAALRFLDHTYYLTKQEDTSSPTRTLTPLEQSVETAALRTLQSYLLGEMDYGDTPPIPRPPNDEDDPTAPVPTPIPR